MYCILEMIDVVIEMMWGHSDPDLTSNKSILSKEIW